MIRFAISTSKDIDINDLRIALLSYIVSKQQNENLIINIDNQGKDGVDKDILNILSLFSIDYTKVVYKTDNIKYHTQMAMKLLLDKKAFNCFCSDEALTQDRLKAKKDGKPYVYSGFCQTISDEAKFNCNAPFVVRLNKPTNNVDFKDSTVILDHKKTPTNHFTNAVDDMLNNTSTIIQNKNDIDDISIETHIRESLGYDKQLHYINTAKIINLNNQSIPTIQELIDDGYLPAAIANYLVSLGFDTPKNIFTLEEAIEWLDISKISQDTPKFDIEELNIVNKEYLKSIDDLRLSKILGYADQNIGKLAKIYLEECNTIKDIKSKIDTIFSSKEPLENFEDEFNLLKECMISAPFINDFNDLKKYIIKQTGLKENETTKLLRYIITGDTKTPNLNDIYLLIKNYIGEIIK